MKINDAGLALIKEFEGFSSKPYLDKAGVWTIGYGHTKSVGQYTKACSREQAEDWLRQDISVAEKAVNRMDIDLTSNQFSALVSLVFNTGPMPLRLTLGEFLADGQFQKAADQFLRWRMSGGVIVGGLERRREAERKLFLKADNV